MLIKNLRTYGQAPFNVAVIHGGPGAPGHMAPVARELTPEWSVLEPLQTAASVAGQVQELRDVLETHGRPSLVLIGSSWGGMLSFMLAARYPALVRKLILVGSGVFEEQYAASIQATRLSRLTDAEKNEADALVEALQDPTTRDENTPLARLGRLFTKADAYNPFTLDTENLEVQYDIHQRVWSEVVELRRRGDLLALGRQIRCPVVAIHGGYDPHPAEGVRKPLASVLDDFRFILLERCGHLPWIEREAREKFFKILKEELRAVTLQEG